MPGVEYKCSDMTKGLERILYKCPVCLAEEKITAGGGHIRCECGFDATLDNTYRLHGAPHSRINEWFAWQQESINIETDSISSAVRLGACLPDGFMDPNAGEGEIYIDKNEFRLTGTVHGEKIEIVTAPEKLGAFPITPGEHFDVYHNGNLIYIYPENPNMSVKWVCYLDRLTELKRAESLTTV